MTMSVSILHILTSIQECYSTKSPSHLHVLHYGIMDCDMGWSWNMQPVGTLRLLLERWGAPALQLLMAVNTEDQGRAGNPWPAGWVKHFCGSLTTTGFTPKIHTSRYCTHVPYASNTCRGAEISLKESYSSCWTWDLLWGRGIITPVLGKECQGPLCGWESWTFPTLVKKFVLSDYIILHGLFCYLIPVQKGI